MKFLTKVTALVILLSLLVLSATSCGTGGGTDPIIEPAAADGENNSYGKPFAGWSRSRT